MIVGIVILAGVFFGGLSVADQHHHQQTKYLKHEVSQLKAKQPEHLRRLDGIDIKNLEMKKQ